MPSPSDSASGDGRPAPRLSVVIPVLDETAIIEQSLRPLQGMRGQELEIVVVDGGSRDDTVARAEPLADRVLVTQPGRARQMNAGWRAARGSRLWFVHADSALEARHAAAVLDQPPDCWGYFMIRLSGQRFAFRVIERAINLRSRWVRLGTGDQGLFADRSLLDRVGGFPEMPLMEDLALSRQLRRLGRPRILEPPLVTSSRRWEQRGWLRTVLTMWMIRGAWTLGVPAERLARWYRNIR